MKKKHVPLLILVTSPGSYRFRHTYFRNNQRINPLLIMKTTCRLKVLANNSNGRRIPRTSPRTPVKRKQDKVYLTLRVHNRTNGWSNRPLTPNWKFLLEVLYLLTNSSWRPKFRVLIKKNALSLRLIHQPMYRNTSLTRA